MLCCLGLLVGFALGSMVGGPWTLIIPALGFGLGLIGDMKLMRGRHGGCCGGTHQHVDPKRRYVEDPVCGMKIDKTKTEYKLKLGGRRYYFCSDSCMKRFREEYISDQHQDGAASRDTSKPS